MFTKEQLAQWRELGFEFDDFYDAVAVDKKEEDYSNDIPTISFKGKAPEKIEINKKTLIEFLIRGESRYLQNNINVELISTDDNISFTTKQWRADYGFTLKTNVTAKKEGSYILQFRINGKDSNALNLSFYAPDKVENCKKELVPALKLNGTQKAQFISTIVAETGMGSELLRDVAWVYLNRVNKYGFDSGSGMKASTAYRYKNINYKLCMYYLGYGNEYANIVYDKGVSIKNYIKENQWFLNKVEPNIDKMKDFIEKEVFSKSPKTCFKDWIGQGYWADLDMNPDDPNNASNDPKWYMARQYYWLQLQKKVSTNFVHIMKDGKNTTFIFDESSIKKYFDNNPSMLPDPENVKKFRTVEGLNFDL